MTDTILVTGGAGFIGSCVARRLVARGRVRVVNVDALTYAGNLDSLESVLDDPLHVFVQGDIADTSHMTSVVGEYRPRAILNLAAESHVDRSIDRPADFVHTNVLGTARLLEVARRYWRELPAAEAAAFRFLQVSTDEVFGSLGPTGAADENAAYRPNSPYAASKAAADHFARAYFRTYGLPVLGTHCSNNYGPYQFPEKLVPLTLLNAVEGRRLPVYGDGQHVRDWIHVEDHASALLLVVERGVPGQTYGVSAGCELSNLEMVRLICAIVDRLNPDAPRGRYETLVEFVPDRPGHDRRYAIDASKIRQELGWRPERRLEEALEQTIHWYRDHPQWVERVTTGVYRRERLGLTGDAHDGRPSHGEREET